MSTVSRRILRGLLYSVAALAFLALAAVAYVFFAWDRPLNRALVHLTAPRTPEAVARGAYLYERSMLCWTCHGSRGSTSASEPQAGGREFDLTGVGPGFGYFYGSNLTPDEETGIGAWSDAELVRAIREGVNREGKIVFPVMAYQFYNGLADGDALALVAYMRSLRPVTHRVPGRRFSFAAKALVAFGLLAPSPAITSIQEAPAPGATVEYGRYLAWHASGCAECHTPRDPQTGKLDTSRPLAGGLFAFPEREFTTTGSNLTPDAATGIGRWTEEQFAAAVRAGVRPNGTVMVPFMPWPSYSQWSEQDLHAVWLYLRWLKPVAHAIPPTRLASVAVDGRGLPRGAALYAAYCRSCHGEGGSGSPLVSVALREAASMSAEDLTEAIAGGLPGTRMPGFGRTLNAGQIEDLVAFVRQLR